VFDCICGAFQFLSFRYSCNGNGDSTFFSH
jgi:hypothetical protein